MRMLLFTEQLCQHAPMLMQQCSLGSFAIAYTSACQNATKFMHIYTSYRESIGTAGDKEAAGSDRGARGGHYPCEDETRADACFFCRKHDVMLPIKEI